MNKVKASALYFVLIISLLLFIFLSLFIIYGKLQKQLAKQYEIQHKLYENVHQAQLLYANDTSIRNAIQDSLCIDLYDEQKDSICLYAKQWGFWNLLSVKAMYGRFKQERTFFYANAFSVNDTMQAALYLRDNQNMLVLAGSSLLKGDCYLPQAGVRPGVLEGKPYDKKEMIIGKQLKSTDQLPNIDSIILNKVFNLLDTAYLRTHCTLLSNTLKENEVYTQSFTQATGLIYLKGKQNLKSAIISGNIIVYSDVEINIDKSAQLKDVIVIAPIVRLEKGFTGSLQVFSTDSLIVEQGVKLSYPSVLFNYQSEELDGKLMIKQGAEINGAIIAMDKSQDDKNAKVEIQKNVTIRGMVWVEGYLQFNASIIGHVFTHKFIWNTTASLYENHLLDASIDATSLQKQYLYPTLFPSAKLQLLKVIE
jgi:hypothetical protein